MRKLTNKDWQLLAEVGDNIQRAKDQLILVIMCRTGESLRKLDLTSLQKAVAVLQSELVKLTKLCEKELKSV